TKDDDADHRGRRVSALARGGRGHRALDGARPRRGGALDGLDWARHLRPRDLPHALVRRAVFPALRCAHLFQLNPLMRFTWREPRWTRWLPSRLVVLLATLGP